MELSGQKGFYDTKRQFQGKDDPRSAEETRVADTAPPLGQVIAGVLFFLVIAVAFFAFAMPPRPVGVGDAPAPPAAPRPAH
jgi:hypothetical protein